MPEVTVSKQYRYTVSKLYKDHLENRITEQELSQRLDELNEEEAKRQERLGPLFIRQALENIEKGMRSEFIAGRGLPTGKVSHPYHFFWLLDGNPQTYTLRSSNRLFTLSLPRVQELSSL